LLRGIRELSFDCWERAELRVISSFGSAVQAWSILRWGNESACRTIDEPDDISWPEPKTTSIMTSASNYTESMFGSARRLVRQLGPGLVTGAADDDPSGIATYSQAGAQFGYGLGWTMFLTTPFMIAIQMVTARIGAVTGIGLAANLAKALPATALHPMIGLLLVANTINIAADIAAMGDALRLVAGGPTLIYIALFGIGCVAAEILVPYHSYSRYLKLLTLVLFAYVAAAFTVHVQWQHVLLATFVPRLSWDRDFALVLVAIFGTTISPYMFFWQASLEAEERKLRAGGNGSAASTRKRLPQREQARMRFDTASGMIYSNLIGFFIIVTTGATLHAHGITQISTAEQAAEALRPLAGPLAFFLFAAGIIGTGLLAVPVLAGSTGYAVAESLGWRGSLEMPPRRAPGFYLIVAASTVAGLIVALTPLNPIRMLFWSAVVNGIVAVPLMAGMMLVVGDRKIMGAFAASRLLMIGGWAATALMAAAVAVMLIANFMG
jgi:NRAMP (natural resistance-associated macrophage protein)-like metal ion transporter